MAEYPAMIVPTDHVEPVPRRIRAMLGNETVFDSTHAFYVWEFPFYPQYYIPMSDVRTELLVDEGSAQQSSRGTVALHAISVGDLRRPRAAKVVRESKIDVLKDTVRFEWEAFDAWFEEDEEVFVHPRNPYVRVDAIRSTRRVRIELGGRVLAESFSPVMVYETGLPTRYYMNPTEVNFSHLVPTTTVTECPYKGTTSGYWSALIGEDLHPDIAWTYAFPTRQLEPIAGMVAFYNERVDIILDGELLERPTTHFSRSAQ